jgi:hypothetical protein
MSETRAGKPVRVGYYYKIKWGYQDEFLHLFKKNHYPVLKAQKESGRLLEILAYEPRFHGDGKSDWTFLSVLVFRDWQALSESQEKEIIKKMFPDQETFQREEQRRFELMEAHWDVPLRELSMEDL